jgi:hypothetical protein
VSKLNSTLVASTLVTMSFEWRDVNACQILTVHAYLNDLRLCCTDSDLLEGVI